MSVEGLIKLAGVGMNGLLPPGRMLGASEVAANPLVSELPRKSLMGLNPFVRMR